AARPGAASRGEPIAPVRGARLLSGVAAGFRARRRRQLAQVLPCRRGTRRSLRAHEPDHGMGHGCRRLHLSLFGSVGRTALAASLQRPRASLPAIRHRRRRESLRSAGHVMSHLDQLESRSVHIFREAYAAFDRLAMLWSIGKDSTVLLWLARKAFFGHVPFPLVHIDTSFKIPEMIAYRDRLAAQWNLTLIYGQNVEALAGKRTYPDGNVDRLTCCKLLKTDAL